MSDTTSRRIANTAAGFQAIDDENNARLDQIQERYEIVSARLENGDISIGVANALEQLLADLASPLTREDAGNRILGYAISGTTVADADALQMVLKSTKLEPGLVAMVNRVVNTQRPDHIKVDTAGTDVRITDLETNLTETRAKLAAAEAKITGLESGTVTPANIDALTKPYKDQIEKVNVELQKIDDNTNPISQARTIRGKRNVIDDQSTATIVTGLEAIKKVTGFTPKATDPATPAPTA